MEKVNKTRRSIIGFVKKFWILALILLAIGGYIYYRQFINTGVETAKKYTVKKETLKDILTLSGEVNASEEASLHFQTGGRLSWVGVKEGDTVKKYAGVASLDTRQLQKTLEKYLNTYSKERRDFEQSIDDNDELAIALSGTIRDRAKRTLENAQFDLNNTVLDVELQAIAKEYSFIYSPIDGIVTRIDATSPGQNVLVTDIFQIVNPDSLYFSVSADQTDVVKIKEGQKGVITLDSYPDANFNAIITSVAFIPRTDESGTVYEVKMNLENSKDLNFRLGMTGDVDFVMDEISGVVAVPIEYIYDENELTYVDKNVGGRKEKTKVEIGREYGGMVEILDGLKPNDEIFEINN